MGASSIAKGGGIKEVQWSCSVSSRYLNTGANAVLGRAYKTETEHLSLLVVSCLDYNQCKVAERLQMANDVVYMQ